MATVRHRCDILMTNNPYLFCALSLFYAKLLTFDHTKINRQTQQALS